VAVAEPTAAGLSWLLFVGSSVHVASTGWLFTARELRAHAFRHRTRYLWVPLSLIAAAALLAMAVPQRALNVMLLAYFGWQFWHYQRQNYGLAALAAASRSAPGLAASERLALLLTGCAGGLGLLSHPKLLQLTITPGLGAALHLAFPIAALGLLSGVVLGVIALLSRPVVQRPAVLCAGYLMALLFFVPVFLFSSPYAAVGGLVIAHGFQYLLLVGLVATGGPRRADRLRLCLWLGFFALGAGTALSVASHQHTAGPAGRLLYGAYLGIVMTHFVVDADVWHLRDPARRAFIASRVPFLLPTLTPPPTPPPLTPVADGSGADIRSAA
jgi:hypothetical protein